MAVLPLVVAPDPRLKKISLPVLEFNDEIRKLMDDMLDTMRHNEAAGIAAVQVGVLKRIFILDVNDDDTTSGDNEEFYVNPEIISMSEECSEYNEGCLSFPGQRGKITRPAIVRIKYQDYHGNHKEREAGGYLGRGFLHENDHLNGILYPERASPLKRQMMMEKARKLKKEYEDIHRKSKDQGSPL